MSTVNGWGACGISHHLSQGVRGDIKNMEDEAPEVTEVGPAMFSSNEVGRHCGGDVSGCKNARDWLNEVV